ncbi:uncharacterized protein LOC117172184 isoform X1 [Belonocnema kinseyi]|uniref:uncharacterized protein LOC117172184 isoform X1 n=1 Tax=Belonocnema kinseyi TaxID=2817044 RepID=UPI00143DD607|nr:uncharacterized protein LOC117172184 isoform X1 [Belonocnema kinseyi]
MSKMKNSFIKATIWGIAGLGTLELFTSYLIPAGIRLYSSCYQEAMQCLRDHPEAVKVLGEPITEGRIDYSNTIENNADTNMTWFTVPVSGPKSRGKMRYWIDSDAESSNKMFRVVRIELQFSNSPDKILLIKRVME